jgi:UDP-2,3-diacylglucosamine pyrophosphatase LpxH
MFVSDVHLGCKYAHVPEFLDFLNRHQPDQLYIVGDFIDGWKLRRSLAWQPLFNEVLGRLYELYESGTSLYYTPGNHDDFLRKFAWNFGFAKVADEFHYIAGDGRKFLVTHGDKFDRVECGAKWMSVLASLGYDGLLWANRLAHRWQGTPKSGAYSFSAGVKRRVKQLVQYVSDFERRLLEHARRQNCDGVICGHIHTPLHAVRNGLTYINTGDWVENCTAFVEYEDGEFELLHYFDEIRRPDVSEEIETLTRCDFPELTSPNLVARGVPDWESEHALGP